MPRFGDALNLNVCFNTLVLDGVYEARDGSMRFLPLPPPGRHELDRILRRIARQVERLMERRAMEPSVELLAEDQPLLAGLASASIRSRIATGHRTGQEVLRRGDRIDPDEMGEVPARADCVAGGGFSLHAGIAVPARDRKRLERLVRYVARPPVATERLSRLADTRLLYRLKRRWRNGTTHMIFEAEELLEKLVSLVPPPRAHQVRYYGVLAPCARRRAQVVPGFADTQPVAVSTQERDAAQGTWRSSSKHSSGGQGSTADSPSAPGRPPRIGPPGRPRRLPWAELMRRVFAVDVLRCPACGGSMRILAAIHEPEVVRAILESMGLPSRAPPNRPVRPEPEDEFIA